MSTSITARQFASPKRRRGRARQALEVPQLEEDPQERKRVLNVLAQRRYRERQKELQKSNAGESRLSTSDAQSVSSDASSGGVAISNQQSQAAPMSPESLTSEEQISQFGTETSPVIMGQTDIGFITDILVPPSSELQQLDTFDTSWFNFAGSWPLDDTGSNTDCLSPGTFTDFMFTMPSLSSSFSSAPGTLPHMRGAGPNNCFSDEHLMSSLPSLTLFNAALEIAATLGTVHLLWDASAISPFYRGPNEAQPDLGGYIDESHLPANLKPTATQRLIPHHPLLDLLPWPSVRDKLIAVLAQPESRRPKELNLYTWLEDMEDETDGVLVRPGVGTGKAWDSSAWEVGGKLRRRWWFIFDSGVKKRDTYA